MIDLLQVKTETPRLVHRYDLARLGVFGSVARGDNSPTSDLDIYAEFNNPSSATLADRYLGLVESLQEAFDCSVQVMTPRMIKNPILKRSIERDLVFIHE